MREELEVQRALVPEAAPWSQPAKAVLATFGVVASTGLSTREAADRYRVYGANQLRKTRPVSLWRLLANQLKSPIVGLLLAAAILSFAVGDTLEGTAIAAAIGLSVVLGFVTELRATRSMEALGRLGAQCARVKRNSVEQSVDATELVPGDIVLFEGGDRITADMRVVEASKLQTDESALTGESVPVGKAIEPVALNTVLAERRNMLYKGVAVTRGAGSGVVVATGMRTELGRIATLVDEARSEITPLEKRLAALGAKLLWVCLAVAAVAATAGIVAGRATMLMVETGIALAVAAIPEGLPAVATIALARGMWRLAARHALIKRLSAVETLGATSIIVTDKTGTLTENQLAVSIIAADDERQALEVAVLCNNASLNREHATGDPLEVALLRAGAAAGIRRADLLEQWPEVREVAFDPDVKMMATVHAVDGGYRVAVKGAPEVVLAASTSTADERRGWLDRSEAMARSGLRILAVAHKPVDTPDAEPYSELTFVGLIALADPPRADVAVAIAACRRAGIRVVMATGDQPATAETIARAVGLIDGDSVDVIHGADLGDLRRLPAPQQDRLVAAPVFARVTPEQKLHLIGLHQARGAVVAMTGDGVNDAPALRKSEIGIAMGVRGTDVARDAADMVLRDDSFDSIVVAIEQGRAIFQNIRRFVIYLLSCNLSEILIVTGGVLAGAALPLLPLQILYLNLVTDVFPALALGFSKGGAELMSESPRDAREPIVARRHWLAITGYAALLTLAVLGAMVLAHAVGASDAEATSVSFLTLGFAQLWHVFNMRGAQSRLFRNDLTRNPWIWGALALCVGLLAAAAVVPALAGVLRVSGLTATHWAIILGASVVPWIIGQLGLVLAGTCFRP